MNWKNFWSIYLPIILLLLVIVAYIRSRIKYGKIVTPSDAIRAVESGLNINLTSEQEKGVSEITKAWTEYGDGDIRKLAYMLATAYHESKFMPVRERRCSVNQSCYQLQERYWNTGYFGRGYVQLTWKDNYKKFSDITGLNLVDSPDDAMKPEIAAKILVIGMQKGLFTRKPLSLYINSFQTDFFNARKTVNALDKAGLIQGYANKILSAFQAENVA